MIIADITSADTGGQSYKLTKGINTHTIHKARSFVKVLNYIEFPYDILHGRHDIEYVKEYLQHTDIIHCHNKYRNLDGWGQLNKSAKMVIHQHGRFPDKDLRSEIKKADEKRNAYRIVSTLNLLNYVDNDINRWLPAPFFIKEMEQIKKENFIPSTTRHPRKIKIAHSPTRRDYKNTDLLIECVNKIPELDLVLIENKPYKEALRLKSMCDITFDQMHLCYGNSGIEGWCFGQAVICQPTDTAREIIKTHIGYEPYIYATEDTLLSVLKELTFDSGIRNHYAELGSKYIRQWHDSKFVTQRIINIYENL